MSRFQFEGKIRQLRHVAKSSVWFLWLIWYKDVFLTLVGLVLVKINTMQANFRKHLLYFDYKPALIAIQFWYLEDFLTQSAIVWGCFFSPGGKQEMLILKTMKKSFEFQF